MKLNKKFILTFSMACMMLVANAQQDAMYTQYMFNTLAINPAYAGSRNVTSATALFRNQWTGIDGAPKTGTITLDAPVFDKRIGLGVQFISDKLGITQTNTGVISAAYRIRMDEGTLAFGIQGSVSQFRADYTSVLLNSPGSGYDPAFADNVSKTLFNFGTGVYYNSDKFYIGLSAQDLISNKLTPYESPNTDLRNTQSMHLFLASGYVFSLSEDFKFKPSFLIKGVKGAPIEGDINATLWIKDVIGLGAQYRTSADVAGLIEIQATPQIRIGYSYDYSTTALKAFNSGSHEIMLRYEFGFGKGKILSPRYF
ncbi:PorP/SprF family type IX secretion system membrane protein [Pedobacter metabolipauper]|uniref:Type IX secretion system PorP/SprF family membrane protein n=1 Tax=Pedobacter metabolipauper TaxID=425513 RepID=A0A4R6T0V7_9SPHI|nr:type IX secretion system membrane protein PorP/SprF [Pedobacter metabolipauper]TDQ12015.1 type IX secretion system PorP/SprF family membrane protein [Pedobacter metabolipauper]